MASAAGQSLHWDQLERLGFSMRCEPRVGHAALLEVHDVIGCHVTVLEQSRRSPVARPPRQALRLKEWAQITLDHVFIGSRMNCDQSPARSRHSHFIYRKELTTSHHIHKFHINNPMNSIRALATKVTPAATRRALSTVPSTTGAPGFKEIWAAAEVSMLMLFLFAEKRRAYSEPQAIPLVVMVAIPSAFALYTVGLFATSECSL